MSAKVHLVKAVVFPVVIYGCESWTVKKAEHLRIDGWTELSYSVVSWLFATTGIVACQSPLSMEFSRQEY